jgi:hypothetical protein
LEQNTSPTRSKSLTAAEFELLDEREAVGIICSRLHELMEGGFELDEALTLAVAPHVDVREATELIRCGCPPETALRILL